VQRAVTRSARRPAAAIEADIDNQWREIDNVLSTLAHRSRARRELDEDEELSVATAASHEPDAQLRLRLEEVTRERDQLRQRLTSTERQLRSARATIRRLEQSEGGTRPQTSGSGTAVTPPTAPPERRVSRSRRNARDPLLHDGYWLVHTMLSQFPLPTVRLTRAQAAMAGTVLLAVVLLCTAAGLFIAGSHHAAQITVDGLLTAMATGNLAVGVLALRRQRGRP